MANILLIASATKVCSVAIAQNGAVAAVKETVREEYSHAELLTVYMEELLKGPWRDKAIDAVCVMDGPGSYTGLRIGVSAAKGYCYAKDIPLLAIGSLRAFALGLNQRTKMRAEYRIVPLMDARRMEVYYSIFDHELNTLEGPASLIVDEESAAGLVGAGKTHFLGDGVAKCTELLVQLPGAVLHDLELSASFMAAEAEAKFNAGQFEDLAYFDPFYLKDFVPGKPKKLL